LRKDKQNKKKTEWEENESLSGLNQFRAPTPENTAKKKGVTGGGREGHPVRKVLGV